MKTTKATKTNIARLIFLAIALTYNLIIKIKEVQLMSDPKIVFKSDVPEEALVSLAMFMMEEMERFIESDIGKEEFERLMREASEDDEE